MTCNLVNNEAELRGSFDAVSGSQTGNEWAIFEYDANSNIIKLGSTGTGGFEELLESFHSGKIQYGFATVASSGPTSQQSQRKVVMVHWQGAGVPAARLAATASHVEEVRKLVRRVNLTIYARSEEDLERDTVAKQLAKLQEIAPGAFAQSGTISEPSASTPFVPPAPVGSAYQKPIVQQDLDRQEREKFWGEMRDEEEARRREEAERRRQQQETYAREQRELTDQLHKTHLERVQVQGKQAKQPELTKAQSVDSAGNKMGKLIAGRAQMFEQKVAELANQAKPLKKPKNFKWQVTLQHKCNEPPVNQKVIPEPPPKVFECAFIRKGTQQAANVEGGGSTEAQQEPAKTTPQIPVHPVPPVARQKPEETVEEEVKKPVSENNKTVSPPPSEPNQKIVAPNENGGGELRAKALWDYQAEDATELTFDPEDLITDIQMVHDGWWYGRGPNGAMGLFPSNYVQLIQ